MLLYSHTCQYRTYTSKCYYDPPVNRDADSLTTVKHTAADTNNILLP